MIRNKKCNKTLTLFKVLSGNKPNTKPKPKVTPNLYLIIIYRKMVYSNKYI